MSRFIDPTTDFGFKKLFGEEANKEIIMSFITDVLEPQVPLLEINFLDKEQLPGTEEERIGIFDLHCRDVEGNYFIVEMQKNRFAFVKDRMLYYSTFPIATQAKKGSNIFSYLDTAYETPRVRDVDVMTYGGKPVATRWDFRLSAIYCIAILGYVLDGSKIAVNRNSLRNDEPPHERFYDKLRFVTVELPLFDERKPMYSLDRHLNKWLYFLKYLPVLDHIPDAFRDDPVFQKAFWVAELANLTPREKRHYEESVKRSLDTYAVLSAKYDEGRTEGKREGKLEGKIEEGQNTLCLLFTQKLGPIPADLTEAIKRLDELDKIHKILAHFIKINDWPTLRRYLPLSQDKNQTSN